MDRRVFFAFAVSLLLLVAVTFMYGFIFSQVNAHVERVNQARRIMTALERLSNHFKSAQIYSQHFAAVTASSHDALYQQEMDSIPFELRRLRVRVRIAALAKAQPENAAL